MKSTKISLSALFLSLFVIPVAIAQESSASTAVPCVPCAELKKLALPDVRIVAAEIVNEEVAYCKVLGIISKEINFELLLPESWNARFIMSGGGGFVGSVQNGARPRVKDGYATAGTDTGHQGNGLKADWALNNMERQLNFGRLAIHRTTVVSKAILNAYYCASPKYAYFMGCSRGGGQALIEAQLYPDDFDGIVAGAPIIDWPATGAEFIQNTQVLYPDPNQLDKPLLSPSQVELLQAAVLDQCDGLDGVTDQILNDPRDCAFDFSSLPACADEKGGTDCFTPAQLKAIQVIYEGTANEEEEIYPGFPYGGENEPGGWLAWIVGPNEGSMEVNFPSLHFAFGTEMFKYLVFQDPDWDYATYDFSNFSDDTRYAASYLNATSTDYSAFKKRGGKMIIYHGWNDPALSAFTTIDHYEAAKKADPQLADYIRLFLLPGVLHCGGGAGPSQTDWLGLVRDWVEKGHAPESVVVSKTENEEVVMSRPIFPYPKVAVYDKKGDPNKADSFIEKKE